MLRTPTKYCTIGPRTLLISLQLSIRRLVFNRFRFSIVPFFIHLYSGSFLNIYSMRLRRGLFFRCFFSSYLTDFDNTPCNIMSNKLTRFVFKPNFTIEVCHLTFSVQYSIIGYSANPAANLGTTVIFYNTKMGRFQILCVLLLVFLRSTCHQNSSHQDENENHNGDHFETYITRHTCAQWTQKGLTEFPQLNG